MESFASEANLAVLIDADNVPHSKVSYMLKELAKYGNLTVKRIYGDWTKPTVAGWKSVLLEHAIQPIQQYSYTSGKNATDSAMIIDAMDLLYSGRVDGFCLISSDSDFTRLATRLREAGKKVIGMGERKTPQPFIVACDKFIYIEILEQPVERIVVPKPAKSSGKTPVRVAVPALPPVPDEVVRMITEAVVELSDEEGWAFLAEVGNLILRKQPDFDPRNYGYQKLTPLVEASRKFVIEMRDAPKNRNVKLVYIRLKDSAR
ncbi:MAG: NYN domain-containing protein [Bacteroidia bacterium]|nr:NYN domain-containing protein [Bacteroidia bacterium]